MIDSILSKELTMRKSCALAGSLAFAAIVFLPTVTSAASRSAVNAAWQERRGHCINEARGINMSDRGRAWRSRFYACKARELRRIRRALA
jgi:TctA family transporter